MNVPRTVACSLLVIALPVGAAAQGFEGVVKQRIAVLPAASVAALAGADTAGGDRARILDAVAAKIDGADPSLVQTQELTVYAKGTKIRVDGGPAFGAGGFAVMDAATDSMYVVMPALGRIMVLALAETGDLRKRAQALGLGGAAPTRAPTPSDLGEASTGGVRLHRYRLMGENTATEYWLDPTQQDLEMPQLRTAMSRMSAFSQDTVLGSALRGKGRLVRVLSITNAPAMLGGGWIASMMELSPPEKRAVDDAMFALPPGLARTHIPDMLSR